jgi:phytoene dehydrogenase-like protein
MGAVTQAMARSAEARGVVIRTNAPVEEILIEGDRAAGVRLASGETVKARAVAVNVPPKLLFRDLVPEGKVPERVRKRFLSIQSGSASFRMNVALSELPDFTCLPGKSKQLHHGSGIMIAPSMSYLEKAYHDARLEGWSREPVIELLIPSTLDETLAPPGKHVASLFVQHAAPHLPPPRSWADPAEKERFADLVIETVNRHAPNFRDSVLGRQVLSPLDLEHRMGLIDGDIFHGQLTLNQLFSLRPVLGYANYRMPVERLYLCGSGAHPGGGVSGVPGHNAAREIIADFRRRRMS